MTPVFTEDRPIYAQIVDYCLNCIASGQWLPGQRIPSVKEMSISMAVNNRTVLRAYDALSDDRLIVQQRGMGYFLAADAPARVLEVRRREFLERTLPQFVERMQSLGLSFADVEHYLQLQK